MPELSVVVLAMAGNDTLNRGGKQQAPRATIFPVLAISDEEHQGRSKNKVTMRAIRYLLHGIFSNRSLKLNKDREPLTLLKPKPRLPDRGQSGFRNNLFKAQAVPA